MQKFSGSGSGGLFHPSGGPLGGSDGSGGSGGPDDLAGPDDPGGPPGGLDGALPPPCEKVFDLVDLEGSYDLDGVDDLCENSFELENSGDSCPPF